ncbi:MAG: hypothetical protein ACLQO1_13955 [Steroidobacteraceae bacterium]
MRNVLRTAAGIAAAAGLMLQLAAAAQAGENDGAVAMAANAQVTDAIAGPTVNPALTSWDSSGNYHHIMPTIQLLPSAVSSTDTGPLLYHGGPIITSLEVYSIYWTPTHLQSGAAASMPTAYQSFLTQLAADYSGHSLSSIAAQYYQTISGVTEYVSGLTGGTGSSGSDAATYVDANSYPASKCTPTAVNCLSDAEIQTEVARVMSVKGWTGGLTKIFVIYLAQGEETCLAANSCSNTAFCGYHGHFTNSAGATVVYANMPYANLTGCHSPTTPSPSGNVYADTEGSILAHEITEAITDPEGTAWFSAQGNEIGDLCAFNFGTNTWDYSKTTLSYLANQMWNGHHYELQRMYDNHYGGCSQVGP